MDPGSLEGLYSHLDNGSKLSLRNYIENFSDGFFGFHPNFGETCHCDGNYSRGENTRKGINLMYPKIAREKIQYDGTSLLVKGALWIKTEFKIDGNVAR